VKVSHGGLPVGEDRAFPRAQPSPDVELPAQVERRPVVREAVAGNSLHAGNGKADEIALGFRAIDLEAEGRKGVGAADDGLGFRPVYPYSGDSEVVVVSQAFLDNRVEPGVAEGLPPAGVVRGSAIVNISRRSPASGQRDAELRLHDRRRGCAAGRQQGQRE